MKILVVSIRSIHTIRWVSQLKDSSYEIHFFDILNGGYIKEWDWVTQHTDWRYKFGDFKGRFFIKNHIPILHKLFENNVEKEFDKILNKIKPDLVHSFVMYSCCVPIFHIMQKHKNIKWIYSAWGNDLYFYKNIPNHKKDILRVLPNIDYMFADCNRDILLAKILGFKGEALGNFPGGGGYHLSAYNLYIKKVDKRNLILIKGYEQRFGKCSVVLKAIEGIINDLNDFNIIVFGADKELKKYLTKNPIDKRIEVIGQISHNQVLELMGKSLIYIGNSISDGMPNTLLEAIIMGVFPIQSNPGGATEEIVKHEQNGLLINDPENSEEIKKLILRAIYNKEMIKKAFTYNQEIKHNLDFSYVKKQVLKAYKQIEEKIKVKC